MHAPRNPLIALALLTAASAGAQESPDAEPGIRLEQVVVTARKQSESVQDVPLSVTAINSERMAELGMSTLQDVAMRTPGLQNGNFINDPRTFGVTFRVKY